MDAVLPAVYKATLAVRMPQANASSNRSSPSLISIPLCRPRYATLLHLHSNYFHHRLHMRNPILSGIIFLSLPILQLSFKITQCSNTPRGNSKPHTSCSQPSKTKPYTLQPNIQAWSMDPTSSQRQSMPPQALSSLLLTDFRLSLSAALGITSMSHKRNAYRFAAIQCYSYFPAMTAI